MTRPDHRDGRSGSQLREGESGGRNLALRIASAAVLAPAVLACAYAGGWIFLILCAAAAGCIFWEWTSLVARSGDPRMLVPGWMTLLSAAVVAGLGRPEVALATIAAGAALTGIVTAGWQPSDPPSQRAAWGAGGVVYAGAALLAPVLLRCDPEWGLTALLFLCATVWITDIFAFFCGRAIGGPLLLPRVSPKKTWSGAIGGLVGGVAAGVLVAYASGVGKLGIIGLMAALLSVLAQAGDLLESAVKRRFGAKDASHLIPGHGGLMDRLDGFLVAAAVALVIGILRQGIAAPGRGLLVW